jgi:glutamate racemase
VALSDCPIGLFDSGMGGLTVARAIIERLPQESLIYFGDTAHVPYGPKAKESIISYSEAITSYLLKKGCKAIVVACNTATTVAIEHLRTRWSSVPIFGMEPAVKPGAKATKTGKIGVLATASTFSSQRYRSLMYQYASNVELLENPCVGLVRMIEDGLIEGPELERFLAPILSPMKAQGADTYVLGCTHYPFIAPSLRKMLGPDVSLIDPAPALARHLESVLQQKNMLNNSETPPTYKFYTSGPAHSFEDLAKLAIPVPATVTTHLELDGEHRTIRH